jgi:hypothetical protein
MRIPLFSPTPKPMDKLIGEFDRSVGTEDIAYSFELALQEGCKPRRRERNCPGKEFALPISRLSIRQRLCSNHLLGRPSRLF